MGLVYLEEEEGTRASLATDLQSKWSLKLDLTAFGKSKLSRRL